MIKSVLIFLAGCFSICTNCEAQNNSILPLTGARFFKEGISVKNIEIKLDGSFLLNNRVPLNKEIEFRLQSVNGFSDKNKMVFVGAELTITSATGVVLLKVPNLYKDKEATGSAASGMKDIIVKVPLKAEVIKAEQSCVVKLRFFDLKGTNQLRVEMPVAIARTTEVLALAKTVSNLKIDDGGEAVAFGLKMKKIQLKTDTAIRVNPKMAYSSIEMEKIEGSSSAEILSGKEYFWVYDDKLNEIKITDRLLKQVTGAMEDNIVDYMLKVPFRLKTTTGKVFTVRFRWESPDKRKLIDIVVTK